jgi:small multidrug resistance family-3 protein
MPNRKAGVFLPGFVDSGGGMGSLGILAVLTLAAAMEAGGDALVRSGLHGAGAARVGFFGAGAVVLFTYGVTVNLPSWDFGRLLGVYVALFFVVAQVINLVAFGVRPAAPIYAGGVLILAGGMVMTFWRA